MISIVFHDHISSLIAEALGVQAQVSLPFVVLPWSEVLFVMPSAPLGFGVFKVYICGTREDRMMFLADQVLMTYS